MALVVGGFGEESLATLQIVQAMLRLLRDKGVLSREEVEEILTDAGQPLKGSTTIRFGKAYGLIEAMRQELR